MKHTKAQVAVMGLRVTRLLPVAVLLTVSSVSGAVSRDVVLSGRVSDGGGLEPVENAVVSLELHLESDPASASSKKRSATLAVWQVRTDGDGRFVLSSKEPLEVPAGFVLARSQLKVFAFGYDTFQSRDLSLKTASLGGGRIRIEPSIREVTVPLVSRPQNPIAYSDQLDSWYAEVRQGIQRGSWPSGEKRALVSFEPLLNLLGTSCQVVEALVGGVPAACQGARSEFNLPMAPVSEARVDPKPAPPEQTRRPTELPVKAGKAVQAMDAGLPQPTPDD